ncbi:olfactory receptor 14J1-like [Melozone crissalis]|uniref:olfactory receptor 14J1-like n=1 Tax=Melozone crissalis TaxID=40204 RepID=UPI0023D9BCD1|nr:olfactory receptor 14J1-like [Melozone crissalis]
MVPGARPQPGRWERREALIGAALPARGREELRADGRAVERLRSAGIPSRNAPGKGFLSRSSAGGFLELGECPGLTGPAVAEQGPGKPRSRLGPKGTHSAPGGAEGAVPPSLPPSGEPPEHSHASDTCLGNGLIISTVACGHHLHTPMFFLLLNLALSDLGSICTTVPKAMHNSLWDTRDISYSGCATQVVFFAFFMSAEFALLTVMCYDRYVSICKPLHYGTLLGSRACAHMAAAAWASAFLNALMHTANTFSLPLCHGNALGQFFCEIPQILKLSCSNSYLRELKVIVFSISLAFVCFVFIVFSYVQIFRAVLRIPSEQGRHKAFSTCLPHLVVVSLFISTAFFAYLKPPSISSPSLDLALSVLYLVVPPALNPLIYSLRNQELKNGLRKIITNDIQKQ